MVKKRAKREKEPRVTISGRIRPATMVLVEKFLNHPKHDFTKSQLIDLALQNYLT